MDVFTGGTVALLEHCLTIPQSMQPTFQIQTAAIVGKQIHGWLYFLLSERACEWTTAKLHCRQICNSLSLFLETFKQIFQTRPHQVEKAPTSICQRGPKGHLFALTGTEKRLMDEYIFTALQPFLSTGWSRVFFFFFLGKKKEGWLSQPIHGLLGPIYSQQYHINNINNVYLYIFDM